MRYTEHFPRLGCVHNHNHICLYDVISFETHSVNRNVFIRNSPIHLSPEQSKPFSSLRVPDRFQYLTAAVGGHEVIKSRRVCEKGLQVAHEVAEQLRLRGYPFQK